MVGFLKKEGTGIGGVGRWYRGMVGFVVTNYTVCQPLYTIIYTQKKILHLSTIHPLAMPREEVDISAITNEPRKRTLSSYVRNQDNISGD